MPVIMRPPGPLPGAPDRAQLKHYTVNTNLQLKVGTASVIKSSEGCPTIHEKGCPLVSTRIWAAREGNWIEIWKSKKEQTKSSTLFRIFNVLTK